MKTKNEEKKVKKIITVNDIDIRTGDRKAPVKEKKIIQVTDLKNIPSAKGKPVEKEDKKTKHEDTDIDEKVEPVKKNETKKVDTKKVKKNETKKN